MTAPLLKISPAIYCSRIVLSSTGIILRLIKLYKFPFCSRASFCNSFALLCLTTILTAPYPLSYIDFLGLVSSSDLVLTDSGGLQEETTHLNVKCLTLRNETERPITVTEGTNKVIGIETEKIIYEINNTIQSKLPNGTEIKFWDGKTSERIYKELYEQI